MVFAQKSADIHIWRAPLFEKCPRWTNSSWLRTSFMDGP